MSSSAVNSGKDHEHTVVLQARDLQRRPQPACELMGWDVGGMHASVAVPESWRKSLLLWWIGSRALLGAEHSGGHMHDP